ncbi:MAG: hypothetical protein QW774_03000 [Candidatus Micrarchaeaceae archaeon]
MHRSNISTSGNASNTMIIKEEKYICVAMASIRWIRDKNAYHFAIMSVAQCSISIINALMAKNLRTLYTY